MKKLLITIFFVVSLFAFDEPPMNDKGKFLNFNHRMVHVIPHFIDFNDFDLSKDQTKELLYLNYEFIDKAKKLDENFKPQFMMDETFDKEKYVSHHTNNFAQMVTLQADIFDRILKILNDKQKTMLFRKLKEADNNFKDKRDKIDRFINGGR